MNEKTTYRTRHGKDSPYFALSRETAQDESISFEARGMLAYLLSKPDNWKVILADLQKNGGIGRDKARRLLNELQAAGYIKKDKQVKNADGTYSNVPYRIYETSQPPCTENQLTDKASTENPTLHNTEVTDDRGTEKDFASPVGNAAGDAETHYVTVAQPQWFDAVVELIRGWKGIETLADCQRYVTQLIADNPEMVTWNQQMALDYMTHHHVKFGVKDTPPDAAAQHEAKPERPRSEKQLANDKLVEALGQAYGVEASNGEYAKYLKIAQRLTQDIPPDQFPDYVRFVRQMAIRDGWTFTIHSLTSEKLCPMSLFLARDKKLEQPEIVEDDIEWVFPCTQPVVQYTDKSE